MTQRGRPPTGCPKWNPEKQVWEARILMPSGGRKPVPYLKTSSNQTNGRFSPDGKWIAYTSDESGHPQVYVQSYPASDDAKWQVSADGGNFAKWRRDGKELFYLAPDGRLRASSVRAAGKGLEFGAPATLFRILEPFGVHTYNYDVAPDGQRILTPTPATANSSSGLTVILNWQGGVNH